MIRRVSTTMVPVAVNLHRFRRGKYSWQHDAEGRRRELIRYRPGTKEELSQYQGIWILAPDGEVLATYGNRDPSFHWDPKINEPLVRAFMKRLDQALDDFGGVTRRDPAPTNPLSFRGAGCQEDGGVTLAVHINRGVLDSLKLSREEWSVFAPPQHRPGTEWTFAAAVVRRFSRILSPISDLGHHPPRPEDVTDARFTGKVTRVEDGVAHLAYSGHIAATRRRGPEHASHGSMRLIGSGSYDTATGALRSLTLVLDGEYRGYPPWDKPRETEALVEWRDAEGAR